MAGKKGRSGRKPRSARLAFLHFAEEYTERGCARFEEWLEQEHLAAMNGDGHARRFLIEQYMGKARQAVETNNGSDDAWVKVITRMQRAMRVGRAADAKQ